MSEKNADAPSEKPMDKQTIDRRSYLKLAGATGSGLGAGFGASALSTGFATSAQAAPTVIEDFDEVSLDDRYEFDQQTATASVTTVSSTVTDNASRNVLQIEGDGVTSMHAFEGDGDTDLDAYPAIGNTISCWMRGLSGGETMNFIYGAQDAANKYYVQLNLNSGHLGLFRYIDGAGDSFSGDWNNSTISNNTGWFKVEIQWTSDHQHTVTLHQDGSEVTSLSYTEGSDDPKFTANGVGFAGYVDSGETAQFDYAITTMDGNGGSGNESVYKQTNIDNFEVADKKLTAYDFDQGESGAEIVADTEETGKEIFGPTYSGTRALEISDSSATEMISSPGDGLENYPSAGDTIKCYAKVTGGADNFNFSWGVQGHENRYYVKVKPESDSMYLFKYKNGNGSVLGSTSGLSMKQDTWYYIEVEWETDGMQTIELYDLEGNVLAECSGADSEWSNGGIGFDAYLSSGETVYFDDCVIVEQEGDLTGGWGPNYVQSYESFASSRDGWSRIDDLKFYLDYEGQGTETTGDGTEYINHYFQVIGVFHTYERESDFQYDPSQQKITPRTALDGTIIDAEIEDTDQNRALLQSHDDENTWALGVGKAEYDEWKNEDGNWQNDLQLDEFKQEAQEQGVLEESDSDNTAKALHFMFDVVVDLADPGGVGLAISTADFLTDVAQDPDDNCYFDVDQAEPNREVTEWDFCEGRAIMACMRSIKASVERGEGPFQLDISHSVESYALQADNTCEWTITCPGEEENAVWESVITNNN